MTTRGASGPENLGDAVRRGGLRQPVVLAAARIVAPVDVGDEHRRGPSATRWLSVPRANGGAAIREPGDGFRQLRLDRELHVQPGDFERPEHTAVVRDQYELAPSLGESRQRLQEHPKRGRIHEAHFGKIHDRTARPVAENPFELLLESRRRESVDLSRHGDDVGTRREQRGADLEADDGHASNVAPPA